MAAELADVDLSKIPLNKPTLDYLHENNVQIPQTEYDDEGNLVESGSILAPESAYTLTEVPAGEDGAAPAGDNIITKYELKPVTHYYDPVTGKEVAEADRLPDVQYKEVVFKDASPVYYQWNLKQTTYGEGNQSYSVTLENSPVKDVIINVLYDNTNTSGRLDITSGTNYGDITSNFIGNSGSVGGAIYNYRGTIGNITGDFIGNYTDYEGGAIYNYYGTIGDITGDFIGNSANSYGGAIFNDYGTIGDITGNFIGNSTNSYGWAIFNDYNSTIGNITGNFIGNSTNSYGGAIANYGTIGDITGDFIGNSGMAISNNYGSTIKNITGNFIGNEGVLYNDGTIETIKGDFINNSSTGNGGAIQNTYYTAYQGGTAYIPLFETSGIIENIINSSFYGNSVQAEYPSEVIGQGKDGKGGAIYTNRDLTITAQDSGQSVFSGNYVQDIDGKKDYQAIFLEIPNYAEAYSGYYDSEKNWHTVYKLLNATTTLTLNANTNGTIVIDDKISGTSNIIGYFTNEYNPETGSDITWTDENGNPES